MDLIRNRLKIFSKPIVKVIYLYSHYQEIFKEHETPNSGVVFVQTVDEAEQQLASTTENSLIIFDDQLLKIENDAQFNSYITDFWVRRSHHTNVTACLVTQNLYSKSLRTVFLNTVYLIAFNPIRDKSQLQYLNRQFQPSKPRYLLEAMKVCAQTTNHPYLLFDFSTSTPEKFRVRSFLYPTLDMKVFVPSNDVSNK